MGANFGNDYVDAPALVATFLQNAVAPRTGQRLASLQGDLTFFSNRTEYTAKLTESLPAVLIDLNSQMPTRYESQGGSSRRRGIPIAVAVFTPVYAYLPNRTAVEILSDITTADLDIKSLYGDIEAMLNTQQGRSLFHELQLVNSPGIEHDIIGFGDEAKIRARVGELWCTAWRKVAGT